MLDVSALHTAAGFTILASLDFTKRLAGAPGAITPAGETAGVWVTHYGESYNGHKLGCNFGSYSSGDPTIVAISPSLEGEMPCGTLLEVCGPGGCQVAARKDGCPGCTADVFDLSEAGIARVCGAGTGVCRATVQRVDFCRRPVTPATRTVPKLLDALAAATRPDVAPFAPAAAASSPPQTPACASGPAP